MTVVLIIAALLALLILLVALKLIVREISTKREILAEKTKPNHSVNLLEEAEEIRNVIENEVELKKQLREKRTRINTIILRKEKEKALIDAPKAVEIDLPEIARAIRDCVDEGILCWTPQCDIENWGNREIYFTAYKDHLEKLIDSTTLSIALKKKSRLSCRQLEWYLEIVITW